MMISSLVTQATEQEIPEDDRRFVQLLTDKDKQVELEMDFGPAIVSLDDLKLKELDVEAFDLEMKKLNEIEKLVEFKVKKLKKII
jgi:hypothetical protein